MSCHKITTPGIGASVNTSPTMTATVNGTVYNFTNCVKTYSNGYMVFSGANNSYTVNVYLKSYGPGIFYLYDQTTNAYGSVQDAFYTYYYTNNSSTGQLSVTQGNTSGTLNGSFFFTAVETSPTPGGATITVTDGSFTNM